VATTLTVTPGTTFTSSTRVTAAMLNAAALPTVSIADGSIPAEALDENSFVAAFGDSFGNTNWLSWGSFYYESFSGTGTDATLNCPDGLLTENARQWFVLPAGAAVTSTRNNRTSATDTVESGKTALKVNGAAALTSVIVGTWLPPALAAQLASGSLTFSCYVWGSALASPITPTLEISTPTSTVGDEGNVTYRGAGTGSTSCASGQWTRVEFSINAAAITNWTYGVRLGLKFTVFAGVMDSTGDYLLIADAQIDKGVSVATLFAGVAPPATVIPAGIVMPYAGATAPPGWLLCNGAAVSRTTYARLFTNISTAYGIGNGTTTFNLPDMRGRTFVGAETDGDSQGRLEVSVTAASSSGDTITVASGAADSLRLGMGAFGNAGIPATNPAPYIIAITATTIQLSAATTSNVTGTVRFSKLGAEDAQTVGADGNGPSYGRREFGVLLYPCSCTASTTLVVPSVEQLAVGMAVSGDAAVNGLTIVKFISATSVQLSGTAGTASAVQLTFKMPAPEGDAERVLSIAKANPVIDCTWGGGASDTTWQMGNTALIKVGMKMTGTYVPANTYVAAITSATDFTLSGTGATGGASSTVTFQGGAESRSTTPTPDTLPAAVGNYIIKT